MRILLVNKFLHPVGGTETVFFNEWRWLEAAGHTVIPFGMKHPQNIANPYERYWVERVDYERATPAQLRNLIWNRGAAARLAALLAAVQPHVAHLHNIYHQLSPSILPVLATAGVPAVMTVHDYKLICPNYRLFTTGSACTRCVHSHPWHALRHRCHKNSWLASALVALESYLHRRRDAYGSISRFIAPSRFVRRMLAHGGFAHEKIAVIPHAVETQNISNPQSPIPNPQSPISNLQSPILYAGRLEQEKGIEVLLAAAAAVPEIPVLVAGTGTLAASVASNAPANVTYLGKLTPAELAAVRAQVRAAVVPSLWHEVFGMSALEAMQAGLPVVASDVGGLAEVVQHERTGLLVPAGDAKALAAAIRRLWNDAVLARQMGAAGRAQVGREHDPQRHVNALLSLFASVRA